VVLEKQKRQSDFQDVRMMARDPRTKQCAEHKRQQQKESHPGFHAHTIATLTKSKSPSTNSSFPTASSPIFP
jgi:hypothetical protein